MSTNIELSKPRDFGEIISDTFTFIRQNFKPLLKYFFIICGFFILISTALAVLTQVKAVRVYSDSNPNSFDNDGKYSRLFALGWGYIIYIAFLVLEHVAITVMVLCFITLYKEKKNQVPELDEMWGYFKYHYFRVLGSSVVVGILVLLGCVFCLIPGIYLYPIMVLVPCIMVIENASFGYSFNYSFRLIKDNWWATFGALVVMYIIVYVASMVVILPATLLNAGSLIMHLTKRTPMTLTAGIVTAILGQSVHILYILMTVAASLCYFNLTESKEGTGLMERINQFGSTGPNAEETKEDY